MIGKNGREENKKKMLLLKSWCRHNSSCSKLIQEDGISPRKREAEEDVEGCIFWVENSCMCGLEFGDTSDGYRFKEELKR